MKTTIIDIIKINTKSINIDNLNKTINITITDDETIVIDIYNISNIIIHDNIYELDIIRKDKSITTFDNNSDNLNIVSISFEDKQSFLDFTNNIKSLLEKKSINYFN